MKNKQTAVEWLFEKINDSLIDFTEGNISAAIYGIRVSEYKYKAKEMEKKEMKRTWQDGFSFESPYKNFEEYYNETYGK